MEFNDSWDALLKPGEATVYFDGLRDKTVQVGADGYSKINAWWMAEFSRLIYRQGSDELGTTVSEPTRQQILAEVRLKERQAFNETEQGKGNTHCAIFQTVEDAPSPYAVLVFRGTTNFANWVTNLHARVLPWQGAGKAHQGFAAALALVWPKLEPELAKLEAEKCPVFYTGHSLGAALATLAAALRPPRALYTFGSPLTGNGVFRAALAGQPIYRVVNNRDVVTTVPPELLYRHVGELRYINHNGEMQVNPTRLKVLWDRLRGRPLSLLTSGLREGLPEPPEYLADHAPVNYVAHLERLFRAAPDA